MVGRRRFSSSNIIRNVNWRFRLARQRRARPETSSFCPPGLFYHLPDLCVVLNDSQQDPMGYGENDPFRDFSFGAI
jgi:hypothetical protein